MSKKVFSLRKLAIAAAAGMLLAAPAFAATETAPGAGVGPGVAGGSEQECDMGAAMAGGQGQGYGMGPGMMGGQGSGHFPGPGMMGGHHGQGYGAGPGMMGGHHGQGYGAGPGMMGGHHGQGYGRGPGMMGGPGRGHGIGMMGGYGAAYAAGALSLLDLSPEQRDQVYKIQDENRRQQWELMGKAREEKIRLSRLSDADTLDDAAMSKSYQQLSGLRQQMFDNSLAARKQLESALSQEQREQLRRSASGRRAY